MIKFKKNKNKHLLVFFHANGLGMKLCILDFHALCLQQRITVGILR